MTAPYAFGGKCGLRITNRLGEAFSIRISDEARLLIVQYGLLPFTATFFGVMYLGGSLVNWLDADTRSDQELMTRWLQPVESPWFTTLLMPTVSALVLVSLTRLCVPAPCSAFRMQLANLLSIALLATSLPRIDIVLPYSASVSAMLLLLAAIVRFAYVRRVRRHDDA